MKPVSVSFYILLLLVFFIHRSQSVNCTCISPILLQNISSSANSCDMCPTGCYLKYLSSFIDTFTYNTTKNVSSCDYCPNNCDMCISNTNCQSCSLGYEFNFFHSCIPNCSQLYDANCLTCTNLRCSSCNTSNNFYLNSASGNTSCSQCNFYKCTSCINGPICQTCESQYYLDTTAHLCMQCNTPCLTCNVSANKCLSCINDPKYYYDNSLTSNQCRLCYHKIANCTQCSVNGTACTTCDVNNLYYVNINSTCSLCNPPCKTCNNIDDCLSCVDYSTLYNSVSMRCESCSIFMPNCIKCLTSTVCLTCDPVSIPTLYYTYPPNKCITCLNYDPNCDICSQTTTGPKCTQCAIKYFIQTGYCVACPYECQQCTAYNICSSCINNNYVLQGSSCVLCSTVLNNCIQCQNVSGLQCINCTHPTVPVSGLCDNCTSIQYPDYALQHCTNCNSPCLSCESSLNCLTCIPHYTFVSRSKKCFDTCGDYIVMEDQCDNGIGVLNNGCSDQCTQQPSYICSYYNETDPVSNQIYNRSICSYTEPVIITLFSIQKQIFQNTITLLYSIKPYLYGFPGTVNNQTWTDNQLSQTFLLKNMDTVQDIKVQRFTYDASTNQIGLVINYNRPVKESQFQMTINTDYIKSFLGTPNTFQLTPNSSKIISALSYKSGVSLAGVYYQQNQYSYAKLISYASLIIAVLTFVAFIASIFTKQVAGLEMAMLCQFIYISLFYYKGTMELPYLSLKSLLYSTGYNVPSDDVVTQSTTPPQSFVMQYNPQTFFDNFNLMAILYILPLIAIIPFIPIKAKCIRKLNIIEIGHKWVDLLLGEISLFVVLFNFQFFLFSLIVYYQNGTNVQNYASTMMIIIGSLVTLCSFIGIIFRPQIYGNFRTVFKYNTELSSESLEERDKKRSYQDDLTQKFEGERKCDKCIKLFEKVKVFINDNYFYKRWRRFHTALTYNHYNLVIIFFTLSTLVLTLIQKSELIILSLSSLMLLQLIILRPYGEISEKLRAIYFYSIITYTSVMRYINNLVTDGELNFLLPLILVVLLMIALLWTYIQLINYFIEYFKAIGSDRNIIVNKVFQDATQNDNSIEEEQALMRKLMKKYQRIQLQYDFNGARNQLFEAYNLKNDQQTEKINQQQPVSYQGNEQKLSKPLISGENDKVIEEEKNFKRLKETLEKQKKKKKKEEMKNKVSGDKMLKLLNLDNFNKYESEFLLPFEDKKKNISEQQKTEFYSNKSNDKFLSQKQQKVSNKVQSESDLDQQSSYQSIEPQNLQEAKQKIDADKILLQQNQHIRYQRAVKVITNYGLQLNKDLIENNYDRI